MTAPATLSVFTIIRAQNGTPIANATVKCSFLYNAATVTATGDSFAPQQQTGTTDGTGRVAFTVVGNDLLSPANTVYDIQEPSRSYQIAPQSTNGSPQQTTAVNVIVNTPTALAVATSNLTGPLTVAGLLTAQAGLAVTGNATVSGNLSVSGTFSPSSLTVTPGEPGIDTATAGALVIGDNTATSIELGAATTVSAGLLTASGGLTVVGVVTLPAAALADAALSANVALKNAGNAFSVGQTITGDLTLATARLLLGAAVAKIIAGATSLSLRNNADSADNLILTDAGLATLRNALSIPPSAGGAIAPTAYGSNAVKINELAGDGTTNGITFSAIPTNFRSLMVEVYGRATNAVTNNDLQVNLNGDGSGVYESERGSLTGAAGSWASSQVNGGTGMILGFVTGTTAPANTFGYTRFTIGFANSSTLDKLVIGDGAFASSYVAGAIQRVVSTGIWHNAAPTAVTSIRLATTAGFFATTTVAVLWGIP
jgi:hypothetical protein